MGGEEAWDPTLEEWVTAEGSCCAAGLAQASDCAFYAAAPTAGEAGWAMIYKDNHDEDIMQEDGSTKKESINEAASLKKLIDSNSPPSSGLWLGGIKYTIVRKETEFDMAEIKVKVFTGGAPKKGITICTTKSQVVVGFFDEDKGQNKENCRKKTLDFAEYLIGMDY